jgi:DNA (cytosine-5)-methyltransferase 1
VTLVLSVFPGIGLLDMAFEQEGFCVVRGPDLLWGGEMKLFNPPSGKFSGIIGGPPCQGHSRWAGVNRKIGNEIAEDLIPEYKRCVIRANPDWWLLENVPGVPDVEIFGYVTTRRELDMRWLGEPQSRLHSFQFGSREGFELHPEVAVFEHLDLEPACLASEGRRGQISNTKRNGQQHSVYRRRRDFGKFCALQGLPENFLGESPFTQTDKYRVVGNGVPLPMGRAIARAVKAALAKKGDTQE